MPASMNVSVGDVIELSDDEDEADSRAAAAGCGGGGDPYSQELPIPRRLDASTSPRTTTPPEPAQALPRTAPRASAARAPPRLAPQTAPGGQRPITPPLPPMASRGVPLAEAEAQWESVAAREIDERRQRVLEAQREAMASGGVDDGTAVLEANRSSAKNILKTCVEGEARRGGGTTTSIRGGGAGVGATRLRTASAWIEEAESPRGAPPTSRPTTCAVRFLGGAPPKVMPPSRGDGS